MSSTTEVSTLRLYLLRGAYLLIAVGLAVFIWPGIVSPPANLSHMATVVRSLLGAVGLLALLGVRYPLKMLPILLFELVWKAIWILAFGLPLWQAGGLDENTRATLSECLMGVVVVLIVMPWGHLLRHYGRTPGDRWRGATASTGREAARG